jgi:hypothetical protein
MLGLNVKASEQISLSQIFFDNLFFKNIILAPGYVSILLLVSYKTETMNTYYIYNWKALSNGLNLKCK